MATPSRCWFQFPPDLRRIEPATPSLFGRREMPSVPATDAIPVLEIPETLNIASYFIDSNIEKGRGGRIAIYEDGRTTTYAQLAEAMNRAGNALRALGVEPE